MRGVGPPEHCAGPTTVVGNGLETWRRVRTVPSGELRGGCLLAKPQWPQCTADGDRGHGSGRDRGWGGGGARPAH